MLICRRDLLLWAGLVAAAGRPGQDDAAVIPDVPLIPAPDDPARWPAFRQALTRWRSVERSRLGYRGETYGSRELAWASHCFCCGFLMLLDEALYDRMNCRWAIERFLDEQTGQFGGYDAVVLWHAYPRIGLDDRNQFDFYRDVPGGLAGLREAVHCLHHRGVRAFIDYNPWDTGTRRESEDDADALVRLVNEIDADGIFLDTLAQGSNDLHAKLVRANPGAALEGEIALPLAHIHDHALSWAQGFGDSRAPGVLRNKWFERRHMQHRIDRWSRDHTAELHSAWMNGSGILVWENVFGSWVGWSGRDRSILRAMLPILRRYASLFTGEGWTPLLPTLQPDVYASRWHSSDVTLWTLVNRGESTVEGDLLEVDHPPALRWFDLIAGKETSLVDRAGRLSLSGRIGPRGLGAFLGAREDALGDDFYAFLDGQSRIARRAEQDKRAPRRLVRSVRPPSPRAHLLRDPPAGMIFIPAAEVSLRSEFRLRECGAYESDHSYFAGPDARPLHSTLAIERRVKLTPYAIDRTPVTNAQFARFLRESGYRPNQSESFLKHWGAGTMPGELRAHPVVWVDLDDARAYARWAGKRLPTEEEWQYAAQGPTGLAYPWGPRMVPNRCNGVESRGTTPVDAFPDGRSPFGCLDMCGNVWEWTESERTDGRTRFAILKGGCWYRAKGSVWYFDGGPRPNQFAAKMLLSWPGLDRCATVGFRCAVDIRSDR